MMHQYNIGELAQIACIWEATARKVGNVHRHADFTTTAISDFLVSAIAVGIPFADECRGGVGLAICNAVERTQFFVKQNTNLGICLLLAPLIASMNSPSIRQGLQPVLQRLTVDDAACVYRAIRAANPGGLGKVDSQDVAAEPTVTLLEAMALAAERDLIARQYMNGFADVFELGVPSLCDGFETHGCLEAAIVECQFAWLTAYPDSLIARKCGEEPAIHVQRRAAQVQELGGVRTQAGRRAAVELDAYLRSNQNRLNPGTTADLVTACLFVALREGKVKPSDPFPWRASDWL